MAETGRSASAIPTVTTRPAIKAEAQRAEDQRHIDDEQEDVHRTLQHIGAHAAEGEPADEEGEDQEDGLQFVESKMHS